MARNLWNSGMIQDILESKHAVHPVGEPRRVNGSTALACFVPNGGSQAAVVVIGCPSTVLSQEVRAARRPAASEIAGKSLNKSHLTPSI